MSTPRCLAPAAVLLAVTASAEPATASPARIRGLEVLVEGRHGDTSLRVKAAVAFEAPGGDAPVLFLLGAQHPLRRVTDETGQRLDFNRRGDLVSVHGRAAGAAERRWTFEYALSLFRRIEELETVFSHKGWLPSEPPDEAAAEASAESEARIELALPPPLVALVPGEARVEEAQGGRRFRFVNRAAAHPLVIGRYAWRERTADGLTARVVVPEALAAQGEALLDLVLGAASFYTRRFGSVGRSDFALAALPLGPGQHGVTFPGLVVLAAADVADPAVFSPRILAHEVAHHWWSLSVRFPDPADAWLAEGLPTYSALLFLEERFGAERLAAELRNSRETALRSRDAPALRAGASMQGGARYTQNYHKAACVLHVLRETIGREAFLGLARQLHSDYAGRALTTGGFAGVASARAGRDLGGFFRGWVEDAGVPRYEVSWRQRPSAAGYEVSGVIKRSGADVEAPVRLRVVHPSGAGTDAIVRVASHATAFRVACPEPARELLFDPGGDLLHDGARVRREDR